MKYERGDFVRFTADDDEGVVMYVGKDSKDDEFMIVDWRDDGARMYFDYETEMIEIEFIYSPTLTVEVIKETKSRLTLSLTFSDRKGHTVSLTHEVDKQSNQYWDTITSVIQDTGESE